jgi:BASS family bile acid:Na+ symporter
LETIDSVRINFDAQGLWSLNIILALIMFGVALDISVKDFHQLFRKPKPVVLGVISQFILLPLVTLMLVLLVKPSPSIALGMFMVAACPGGNISNFMTQLSKGNTALSVTLTAIATFLAVLMTPLNFQLYSMGYAPASSLLKDISIEPLQMIRAVALLLGLPLVLGMFFRYKWPRLAHRLSKWLKVISLLFFVLLVFVALYQNRTLFWKYAHYVFGLVLLHNFLALTTGFGWGKLWRLANKDVRTLTIETGIQNSGLGLLLIFSFFEGLGGMALLTAFWGVWHLVSGLVLGAFWGRKPFKNQLNS